MIRKLTSSVLAAALLVATALLAAPSGAAAARVPPWFIGVSPQVHPNERDFALMRSSGLRRVRLPLYWSSVESANPYTERPDWSSFDRGLRLAARHGMLVLPFVWGTPSWLAPELLVEPGTRRQLRAWASFLRRAVRRYGPRGIFWRQNPELPYAPVRDWEIWNEQNLVTWGLVSPRRFARLIRVSGRVLLRTDPGARLILGGLFGRPLQVPPNARSDGFLARLYREGDVKRWFDGVALHPYVSEATAIRGQIRDLRRVMRFYGDEGTPIYLTELGWGSDGHESRWERGLRGQARQLDRAFAMLLRHRRAWRIGGVWWFSWVDMPGACQFCDSSGLLTVEREAKPSWYRFNAWTGGDPTTARRAEPPRSPRAAPARR